MRNAFADEMTRPGRRAAGPGHAVGRYRESSCSTAIRLRHRTAFIIAVSPKPTWSALPPAWRSRAFVRLSIPSRPFITTRCLEQIRNDVCYHNAPVVIVGVGSGLGYAGLGPTHHSCEDIALLRARSEHDRSVPCRCVGNTCLLNGSADQRRPVYMRIGKKGRAGGSCRGAVADHRPRVEASPRYRGLSGQHGRYPAGRSRSCCST